MVTIKTRVRRRAMAILALAIAAATSNSAWSQTPKTIKIVVPNPPGGVSDLLARLVADEIGRKQGQAFLIETRPGAAGDIGSEAVSRAAPDGETLLINANPLVVNANLRKLNFDPLADLVPICQLGRAPAVNALLGEHVTSYLGNYADVREQAAAGKLRVLATGSMTRTELLPDVPTIAEAGFPSVHMELWFGIFAPGKTPDETQARLAAMLSTAVRSADLGSKLVLQGLHPTGICGAEFRDFVRSQYEDYRRIIRETNFPTE